MRPTVPRRWPAPRPWSGRRRRGQMGGRGGGSWIIRFYKPVPGAPGAFRAPGYLVDLDAMGCCYGGFAFPVAAFVSFPLPLPAPRCKPLSVQPLVRLAQARAQACALALACCAVPPGAPAQEPAPPTPLTPSTPSTAPVPPDLRTTPRLQEKIPQALQPQLPVL